MKFNNIVKGLILSLVGTAVNAAAISGASTVQNVKSLSKKCFEEGGIEYHYDPTPGSVGRVCIKRTMTESTIIQSTNSDCPVGSIEDYTVVVKCYNSLLQWGKMFYETSTGTIKEYEPISKTEPEPIKTTKTVPETNPTTIVIDDRNEGCTTKMISLVDSNSDACFKLGGNIYYHNSKPRVCQMPNEVCVKKVDKEYEIIDSNYIYCRDGDKGTKKELKKCLKNIKKWSKVVAEEEVDNDDENNDDINDNDNEDNENVE